MGTELTQKKKTAQQQPSNQSSVSTVDPVEGKDVYDDVMSESTSPQNNSKNTTEEKPSYRDAYDGMRKFSGKSDIKFPEFKEKFMGFNVALAGSAAIVSNTTKKATKETTKEEEGFKPKLVSKAELRARFDVKKNTFMHIIKTAAVELEKETSYIADASVGKIYWGKKTFIEGPEVSVSKEKKELKLIAIKGQIFVRWELEPGLYADGILEVSLSPTASLSPKDIDKIIRNHNKKKVAAAKKILSGAEKLRKAAYAAARENKARLISQLKKFTTTGSNKYARKGFLSRINDVAKMKNKAAAKRILLKEAGMIGRGADNIINQVSKKGGIKNLKELSKLTGIAERNIRRGIYKYRSFYQNTLGGRLEQAAIDEMKEKITNASKAMAEFSKKRARKIFLQEALKEGGKRTVKSILKSSAARLGIRLTRVFLRVIPFVNIIMIAWDVFELGMLVYTIIKNYKNKSKGGNTGSSGSSTTNGQTANSTGKQKGDAETMAEEDDLFIGPEMEDIAEKLRKMEEKEKKQSLPKGEYQHLSDMLETLRGYSDNVQRIWFALMLKNTANLSEEKLQSRLEQYLDQIPPDISDSATEKAIQKIMDGPEDKMYNLLIRLYENQKDDRKTYLEAQNAKGGNGTKKTLGGGALEGRKVNIKSRKVITAAESKILAKSKEVKDLKSLSGNSVEIDPLSMSPAYPTAYGQKVTFDVYAYDADNNLRIVTGVSATVYSSAYHNAAQDKMTKKKKEATHIVMFYKLSHPVGFSFPKGIYTIKSGETITEFTKYVDPDSPEARRIDIEG